MLAMTRGGIGRQSSWRFFGELPVRLISTDRRSPRNLRLARNMGRRWRATVMAPRYACAGCWCMLTVALHAMADGPIIALDSIAMDSIAMGSIAMDGAGAVEHGLGCIA